MKLFFSLLFIGLLAHCFAQDEGAASLQDRLRSNVYLKVEASSTDIFVGEPIIVSYKLYSALASESNMVSRPAFVGFDIKDLSSVATTASRENIDGVVFDVHTILKLQLTPYKSGKLSLGPLTMRNRVRLVDANGNKDPILDGVKEDYSLSNGSYNFQISSVPLTVLVTDLPGNNRFSGFNGVVGFFEMNVNVSKPLLTPNEKGELTVTMLGVGDFSKIALPKIDWPKGIEVFAAKIDEDKTKSKDGDGYKSFTIPFKATKPGKYVIPSIQFSFFDITTNKYKTLTNIPVAINVVEEGNGITVASPALLPEKNKERVPFLAIGLAALAFVLLLVWLINKRRKPVATTLSVNKPLVMQEKVEVSIDSLLMPVKSNLHSPGNTFCNNLKQAIVQFFEKKYRLPHNEFNQETVKQVLAKNNVAAGTQMEVLSLLTDIDMNIYSGGGIDYERAVLLNKATEVLYKL